ncbi:uncharacterized protein MONBRDRAFT_34061 [Monosiga brevicollis MX1]|uniref:Uncharacterized protein n=1 Tax=Monosiga brevicollis TaxID=81824 RepID=A9V991_MONBE|nr:uncharacterized protein MONBRDRAFT_34061 [Monosiga brevicollis MX1]EDQ85889.1 predicted protein [Monosiga brevicollis MX1]|eukprot:XP_001749368.1 hypothetical protein [Monosiga brevicollis MX1]
MANMFQRVASWLANEIVTKSLARAPWFQRFAQTTHKHVTRMSEEGSKRAAELEKSEFAAQLKTTMDTHSKRASTFGNSFMRNLKENYKKLEEEGRRLQEEDAKRRAK